MPRCRLGPSDRPMAWIPFELSNVCCIAVPRRNRTRRFHALFDKVTRSDVMWQAWVDVAANRGAPGVDGVTIAEVADGGAETVWAFLDDLAAQVRAGTYRPSPLRRVQIPKPGKPGRFRPLGIPTVADRVVMTAAKIVLEPIFEADFFPVSFGFRPKRSAHQALEAVRRAANQGRVWVLDADIEACFDNIDQEALMGRVERRVVDRQMLKLLRSWLRAGVFEGGVVSDVEAGTPQGSPISPLLANIVLHVLDRVWATDGRRTGVLVRYADDLVVLSPTRARAEQTQALIETTLVPLGLGLHPDKTRIVNSATGRRASTFSGSTIAWWSPERDGVVGGLTSGRPREPWPRSEARSVNGRHLAASDGTCAWSSKISILCCGAGAPTSGKETRRPASVRSTPMCTNGWHGWSAGNTRSQD